MSTPTFDSVNLVDSAEVQVLQPPTTRTFLGTLPGIEGMFSQDNPIGGSPIVVTGLLTDTGASSTVAVQNLVQEIEALQAKQGDVATYVGTDARTYTNVMLQTYTHSQIVVGPTNGANSFTAVCNAQAVMVHLVPSDVS